MKWGFATFVRAAECEKRCCAFFLHALHFTGARIKNPIIIIILHQHLGNAAAAIHYISRSTNFCSALFILRPYSTASENPHAN